ncbi:unnamed protein product, partial [Iphiclides podalirius]
MRPLLQSDGRHQAPKIHSSRPSPELAAGADGSMTVARGEGSPERLGGALRRLHYKATRRAHSAAARHHGTTTPSKVRQFRIFRNHTHETSTLMTPWRSCQGIGFDVRGRGFDSHTAQKSFRSA